MTGRKSEFEAGGPDLAVTRVDSHAEFVRQRDARAAEVRGRTELERGLLRAGERFDLSGDCFVCGRPTRFGVSYEFAMEVDGILTPNWREVLHCRGCGLNNRMRAALHFLDRLLAPDPKAMIYLTEQVGPLYEHLRSRFTQLVGSEYLPADAPLPPAAAGIRNEDLQRLSFGAETFDFVMTFDVLEHVPDHAAALRELHRILRPGGKMLFSVPFRPDRSDNITRAVQEDDGTITHLLPPEYHGDPLRSEGCLAFHHFGWQLLDELRAVGFSEASAHFYWSRGFAYLGPNQRLFLATK